MPEDQPRRTRLERWDVDQDGRITDDDLAQVTPPPFWHRFGLRGPVIVFWWFTRNAKRLAVLVGGGAILAAGVAMLVLPGPGVLIVLVGLAVLATEFAWAERALDATTSRASRAAVAVTSNRAGRGLLVASGSGMVLGGIAVVALVPAFRMVGVTVGLAGVIALLTLLPFVQSWLERQQDRGRRRAEPPLSGPPPGD
jgi:uncharacterized protein (TIGR02611 family)